MLKILLRKQFQAFGYALRPKNKKTGKKTGKGGAVGMAILFGFCALSLASAFVGLSYLFLDSTNGLPSQIHWFFFTFMGIVAIIFGTIGSVFNTYSGIYQAKDNELLLSMPIKPSAILISRIVFDYIMSLLYCSVVWLPCVVMYQVIVGFNALALVFGILLLFVIATFCLTLSLILGWVVALIASHVHSKVPAVILGTLAIIGLYYFIYVKANDFFAMILSNAEKFAGALDNQNPLYWLGSASVGKPLGMLFIALFVGTVFAIVCAILSRTFIGIATRQKGAKGKVYVAKEEKSHSLSSTLLRREFKHFLSSPAYMFNCGLGVILLPVLCIVLAIKAGDIRLLISVYEPYVLLLDIDKMFPLAIVVAAGMVSSMSLITAPSISLEGNSIWILQSMPTDTKKVLWAKQKMHLLLNIPVVVIAVVMLSVVLCLEWYMILMVCAFSCLYVALLSALGLVLDLKKPNLTWTTETEPIKRSIGSLILIFGGWAVNIAIGVGYWFIRGYVAPWIVLCGMIVALAVCVYFANRWINTKGTLIFEKL